MNVNEKYVLFDDTSKSQKELFEKVEVLLQKEGVVKEGFGKALLEREKNYPTGIGLNGFNIAMCHTDPEYSLQNEVMLIKLEDSLDSVSMETQEFIPVNYVFILVLKDGGNHLEILQKLALIMQDKSEMEKIVNAKNKVELSEVINEAFKER